MPKILPNEKSNSTHGYWCKHCGSPDSAGAWWSETVYGRADIVDPEGQLEGYDEQESDNFQIDNYYCQECRHEEVMLEDLITTDWNEVCKLLDGKEKKE